MVAGQLTEKYGTNSSLEAFWLMKAVEAYSQTVQFAESAVLKYE